MNLQFLCLTVPMNFPVISVVFGPRPNKLVTLVFNLFMKPNPRHTLFFKKDKMGNDIFMS